MRNFVCCFGQKFFLCKNSKFWGFGHIIPSVTKTLVSHFFLRNFGHFDILLGKNEILANLPHLIHHFWENFWQLFVGKFCACGSLISPKMGKEKYEICTVHFHHAFSPHGKNSAMKVHKFSMSSFLPTNFIDKAILGLSGLFGHFSCMNFVINFGCEKSHE